MTNQNCKSCYRLICIRLGAVDTEFHVAFQRSILIGFIQRNSYEERLNYYITLLFSHGSETHSLMDSPERLVCLDTAYQSCDGSSSS